MPATAAAAKNAPKAAAPKAAAPKATAPKAAAHKPAAPTVPARGAVPAAKTIVPACGFGVGATKKGELPLKVEKRARGKKVTVIPNVTGDASKLVRALQTMLGVGGTARQAERGSWAVEVQGEQTERVTKALLDFKCLQGLTKAALERLQESAASVNKDPDGSVVARNVVTKFLARTQEGKTATKEERQKAMAMEFEFYGQYWETAVAASADDFSDVWEETLAGDNAHGDAEAKTRPKQSDVELTFALKALGMFPETGRAVREFWEKNPGLTVAQFRKMAVAPGARLIGEGPAKKELVSNLVSRQKVSDRKMGGGRTNYFSYTCSVIDAYQRGITLRKEEAEPPPDEPEEPKMNVTSDEEGWCTAAMIYVLPLRPPSNRFDEEECSRICRDALSRIEAQIAEDLSKLSESLPGVECRLDSASFNLALKLHEREFLHAAKRDSSGKPPDANAKEELRLEKKLREIAALKRRQVDGETLEKLQVEKVSKRGELFEHVAELKLRKAEKELRRVFKGHSKRFQEAFWDCEQQALFGDSQTAPGASASNSFGTFDESECEGPVALSSDASRAEGGASQWAGVRLHLLVRAGEVGAFAVEVLEGLLRLGWVAPGGSLRDLGGDDRSFGFGGTGKKVHCGSFESYGQQFVAGDVIHCEAEREDGQLRLGFAKNNEPLGIAYDMADVFGNDALAGAICGKGFKARLVSAECMPLEDAPGLVGFVEYDPPRLAVAVVDFGGSEDECLQLWTGETVNVTADDGTGWLFGFFLDVDDPDDGGWFPAESIKFFDEATVNVGDVSVEDIEEDVGWEAPPVAVGAWGDPPPADELPARADDDEEALAWEAPSAVQEVVGAEWGAEEGSEEPAQEIVGLAEWLKSLALQKYEAQATAWCHEMGAVSIREVEENWEEFADSLGLRPLERTRLRRRATSGVA